MLPADTHPPKEIFFGIPETAIKDNGRGDDDDDNDDDDNDDDDNDDDDNKDDDAIE
jgi:hypothetical protein